VSDFVASIGTARPIPGCARHSRKNAWKWGFMNQALQGKVALVAGATRGAGRGIAVELGAAGATVYATGRTTRAHRSDYERSETIEDTAELVTRAGGTGVAVQVDHLRPDQVRDLVRRIDSERGRLDVLVNDVGGEHLMEWNKPLWEHSLDMGLRRLRTGIDAHMITSHFALALLIRRSGGLVVEVTDGTSEYNDAHYRAEGGAFFDLTKVAANRLAYAQAEELRPHGGTAVAVTPGWLRSEMMLDNFGVSEDNWRDATAQEPHFCISETPRFVGRAIAALAGDPDVGRWSGQSLSSGYLAKIYGFTDLDGSRPDAWRYIQEVERAGKPADATGYR
jgi:NAD(P)-dependent dehydrogenase (short-subunit alcohol dehydrogenase family)